MISLSDTVMKMGPKKVMGSKSKIFIILVFATGGELFDKIVNHGRMREDEARRYFQQLINAVDYCHSRGVYHRDLKPENLLLDAYGNLKVSDFGLSALSQQVKDDGLLHITCGTPNYVAPEVFHLTLMISLKEAFMNYGEVVDGKVEGLEGFGFVIFISSEEASAIINGMDGKVARASAFTFGVVYGSFKLSYLKHHNYLHPITLVPCSCGSTCPACEF
ncbi:hypothetical protein ZIOFF_003735 [Zingiber officinale]|uniref:Protein kinase domain-containing protein n=1 Tax=Zingiber officinale TaxID=94328 RepID=A0A8J5I6W2_ZINOF|nr:hypothetical protein ZIOFF_003735 [Zingiber officinale]